MADILIRGMAKMPWNCRECCFAGFGGIRHELNVCMLSGESQPLLHNERMSKCPLIPLPEGHGRLIDAEELIERVRMDDRTTIIEEMHIAEILSEAPTIVPAEGGGEDG